MKYHFKKKIGHICLRYFLHELTKFHTSCTTLQVDEAETKDALIQLLAAVQKDNQICIDKLEMALSSNNLNDAKEQLIALRYLLSLENSIKEKGNRIGIIL